jgi:hypothetical protein
MVKKLKWRVLKKVAGVCVIGQQLFDRAPQLRIVAAGLVEKRPSLARLARQCSLEQ